MPSRETPPYDPSASEPPSAAEASAGWGGRGGRLSEVEALDVAVYAAIAAGETPTLDRGFGQLSRAADRSKLWIATAGILAATGGARGRHAATDGIAAVALTSGVVNLVLKPLGRRGRPDRVLHQVPIARHVAMPSSTSFPSGHSASAFAFASGVAREMPITGALL